MSRFGDSGSRFTVREYIGGNIPNTAMSHGFAVYDYDNRITITWPTWDEAEEHRKNIAEYYLSQGW